VAELVPPAPLGADIRFGGRIAGIAALEEVVYDTLNLGSYILLAR